MWDFFVALITDGGYPLSSFFQSLKRFYMNKLYLFLSICAVVCGAYLCGTVVADARCRARISQQNLQTVQNIQNQITKNKRIIHDTVYKMGVDDVRRILRDKYTIGE